MGYQAKIKKHKGIGGYVYSTATDKPRSSLIAGMYSEYTKFSYMRVTKNKIFFILKTGKNPSGIYKKHRIYRARKV